MALISEISFMSEIPDTPLDKMLRNQSILLEFIAEKLDISKFLRWGFEQEIPVLYENAFLHFTSHMCLRSAIIDMCALLDNHRYQALNFHQLIDPKKKFIRELSDDCILEIKEELDKSKLIFSPVKAARDKEIAHYRYEESFIHLSHDLLPTLLDLYNIAADIHDIAHWGRDNDFETDKWFKIGVFYEDGGSQNHLLSLQRLLKRINSIDYKKLYEAYLSDEKDTI